MIHFVPLLALAVQAPTAPTDGLSLARALAAGEIVAEFPTTDHPPVIAPDGTSLGWIDPDGTARALALDTGQLAELLPGRAVTAVAPGPANSGTWVGLETGELLHLAAGSLEPRLVHRAEEPIDGLCLAGDRVAWSAGKHGAVFDATGRTRLELEDLGHLQRQWRRPRLVLSADGAHALSLSSGRTRGGTQGLLRVHSLRNGELVGCALPYGSQRWRCFAQGGGRIAYATREGSSRWRLEFQELKTGRITLVDGDARGKHFVDLRLSPDGRFLMEGDFEEEGACLYDLERAGTAPRVLGEGDCLPLGFLVAADGSTVALTSRPGSRSGLAAWSAATGARLEVDLTRHQERRLDHVTTLPGGGAALLRWTSLSEDGRSYRYHGEVLRVD